jgi:hypothetical protein
MGQDPGKVEIHVFVLKADSLPAALPQFLFIAHGGS